MIVTCLYSTSLSFSTSGRPLSQTMNKVAIVPSPSATTSSVEMIDHLRIRCHSGRGRLPTPLGSFGRDCLGIFSVFRRGGAVPLPPPVHNRSVVGGRPWLGWLCMGLVGALGCKVDTRRNSATSRIVPRTRLRCHIRACLGGHARNDLGGAADLQ